jgi:Na+/proline symporter
MLSVLVLLVFVLLYAGLAGLWGVVATDFVQFVLALIGAVLVAWFAIRSPEVGGLSGLVTQAQAATDFDVLAFVPFAISWDDGLRIGWSAFAGISASTFFAYVFVQWWTFRRSDGGGEFIQRLVASRDEQHAEWAAWLFNILHYVIRTWPWVLVALAALVVYPDLEDPEMGYPKLMLDYLPVGVLGLAVASLLAAFMSTVSTQINWGASYLTHDVYARFVRPEATQNELVLAGRAASVLIATIGAIAAFFSESVATIFRLVIAIGTGPGVVLILRWFWWRINAWAELSAMCAGFLIGLTTTLYPGAIIDDFGLRLGAITVLTGIVWISVMYATKPESAETLRRFYRMARPGGPGWARQRAETGVAPAASLSRSIWSTVAAVGLLFGIMFATGGVLLLRPAVAVGCGGVAAVSGYALYRLRQRAAPIIETENAPPASP